LILEILWSQRTKSATSNYKAQDDWRSFKGSLSETLVNAVQAGLASKMTKVYSWSIDFFKLKKRDFGLVLRKDILMILFMMASKI
jgi:hypothetical protein